MLSNATSVAGATPASIKEPAIKEPQIKERRARGRPKASVALLKKSAKNEEQNALGASLAQRMKKGLNQIKEIVAMDEEESDDEKKKDKKLVFLSRSVLQKVRERPMVTGTQIANEILEMYKKFCDIGQKVDFKNVQRRVYDALNVLSAMDIIRKDKYNIIYNHYNEHIPSDFGLDWSEESEENNDADANAAQSGNGAGDGQQAAIVDQYQLANGANGYSASQQRE